MARTHGTRSAYNAGCRCDSCREASRLARARQREAARETAYQDDVTDDASGGSGLLVMVALALLMGGGVSLWRASRPPKHDETVSGADRTRRSWIVGGVLTAAGVASLVVAVRG